MTLPVVKRGAATAAQWSLESWTPAGMSEELGSTELDVRFSLRRADRGLVEGDSERERCRLDAFMDWLLGRGHGDEEEGGLARKYPPQDDQWWAYASYIYVSDLWKGRPEVQARFPWSTLSGVFGEGTPAIPIDKPENCAMWIGSKGAFTPCHYDVYGCNVAVQLHGHKTWLLFPPDQSACLYPTRLPYEESTVFSQVNLRDPDLERFPKFADSKPLKFTLAPGDALFVPRHWWHFVTCDDLCVSVNQWIPLQRLDDEARATEAITRYMLGSLYRTSSALLAVEDREILNMNESHSESEAEDWALLVASNDKRHDLEKDEAAEEPLEPKRQRIDASPLLAKAFAHAISHPDIVQLVRSHMSLFVDSTRK